MRVEGEEGFGFRGTPMCMHMYMCMCGRGRQRVFTAAQYTSTVVTSTVLVFRFPVPPVSPQALEIVFFLSLPLLTALEQLLLFPVPSPPSSTPPPSLEWCAYANSGQRPDSACCCTHTEKNLHHRNHALLPFAQADLYNACLNENLELVRQLLAKGF